MSDSCCPANSSDRTDGVERTNSSSASHDQQHPTAIEHKVEEVVSLFQNHTHRHDSTGSRIRRRTTHTNPTNNSSGDLIGNRGAMNWGKLRGAVITLTVPEKKVGKAPTVMQSVRSIVCATYLNVLLVFIPFSWAFHFAFPDSNSNKDTLVFVFSFIALIPLAKSIGYATGELSIRVGQTLASLLNATLGNALAFIVAIIALAHCQVRIVQASLIGSILNNLLLRVGLCFFAGGIKYSEQGIGAGFSQVNASLLTISVIAVLLPAAFHFSSGLSQTLETHAILSASRGTAIILLITYGAYLLFLLYSHAEMFEDNEAQATRSKRYAPWRIKSMISEYRDTGSSAATDDAGHTITGDEESGSMNDEVEKPTLNAYVTIGFLVIATALTAVTVNFLVKATQGLVDRGGVRTEFVGVILLPVVGNVAGHVTDVTASVRDKLNMSLTVAAGSSRQIALFVLPFIVTLGWIMDKPMTFWFDPYESITLFFSILVVKFTYQDGKSNWMKGFMLISLYLIIALTLWFYPGTDISAAFAALCA